MKLVNVIQRYPPAIGGSEVWCQEVSRELASRGHHVRVLTLDVDGEEDYWGNPLDHPCRLALGRSGFDGAVRVRRYRRSLPIYWLYHAIFAAVLDRALGVYFYGPHSAEMYGKLWREIRDADAVLLHALPHPHNAVGFAMAKLLRKPTILVPFFHAAHPFYERRLHYAMLRRADAVLAMTEHEAGHFKAHGVAPERICVVGAGIRAADYVPIDLDGFRRRVLEPGRIASDERRVVFIGRKTPEKGVGDLVAVCRRLSREIPLRVFLVGPRFEWCDRLLDGLEDAERERIVDLGPLAHPEKVALLHSCDLLVLPSRYESFGMVVLEAWLCGVPVIGTGEGAMPGVIGEGGEVCRFGDLHGLETKMRALLGDEARRRELAENGRRRALARFTWERVSTVVESALRDVAKRRRVGRRVLICSNAYPPRAIGGAEIAAHEQAKRLVRRGYEVTVFAGEQDEGRQRYALRRDEYDGIPVYRVSLHREDYSWEFHNFRHPAVERLFAEMLDQIAPEIVHFHNLVGLSANLPAAARLRNARTVMTLHDYWGFCFKHTLIDAEGGVCRDHTACSRCMSTISAPPWTGVPIRLRRDFVAGQLSAVDVFVAPSAYLAERYAVAGIDRRRIREIPYGIDLERFRGLRRKHAPGKIRFGFVGYLGEHKGLQTLIQAVAKVPERESIRLQIVGVGERQQEYERQLGQLGLLPATRFWGQVDNRKIGHAYAEMDVLVLPSRWPENHPVTITEAMACGIPVVASRIGGIPELVADGETGLLFEPGNTTELAKCLSALIADPARRIAMGERALEDVARLALERHIDSLATVYEEKSPPRDTTPMSFDVACLGRGFDSQCASAVERLARRHQPTWRFAHAGWLTDEELSTAKLAWVVDPDIEARELAPALRNGVPVLVPEANRALRDLVVSARCGLYYRDADEAERCLEYLAEEETLRLGMGRNGFGWFLSRRELQAEPLPGGE